MPVYFFYLRLKFMFVSVSVTVYFLMFALNLYLCQLFYLRLIAGSRWRAGSEG